MPIRKNKVSSGPFGTCCTESRLALRPVRFSMKQSHLWLRRCLPDICDTDAEFPVIPTFGYVCWPRSTRSIVVCHQLKTQRAKNRRVPCCNTFAATECDQPARPTKSESASRKPCRRANFEGLRMRIARFDLRFTRSDATIVQIVVILTATMVGTILASLIGDRRQELPRSPAPATLRRTDRPQFCPAPIRSGVCAEAQDFRAA